MKTLRIATPDDAEAVRAIYAPVVTASTISFELEPPSVPEMRSRITATLATLPWLVSLDAAGQVDGFAYAGRHRERPAYAWAADTTVYVREDARGQRVGTRLYAELFSHLSALGYHQAFAGIALPNAASVALHESAGFVPVGVFREVGFKFGAWRDVGWWQRRLGDGVPPGPPGVFRAA